MDHPSQRHLDRATQLIYLASATASSIATCRVHNSNSPVARTLHHGPWRNEMRCRSWHREKKESNQNQLHAPHLSVDSGATRMCLWAHYRRQWHRIQSFRCNPCLVSFQLWICLPSTLPQKSHWAGLWSWPATCTSNEGKEAGVSEATSIMSTIYTLYCVQITRKWFVMMGILAKVKELQE